MKIKKSQLKQLIKEELEATMDEGFLDKIMGRKEVDNQTLLYYGPRASCLHRRVATPHPVPNGWFLLMSISTAPTARVWIGWHKNLKN